MFIFRAIAIALFCTFWVSVAQAQSWQYKSAQELNQPDGLGLSFVDSRGFRMGVGRDVERGHYTLSVRVRRIDTPLDFTFGITKNGEYRGSTTPASNISLFQSSDPNQSIVAAYVSKNNLEQLMSGDSAAVKLGSNTYAFPLKGSRAAISQLMALAEVEHAAREDDRAHTIAQAISDCDQLAAHRWDKNRVGQGVSWGDIQADAAVETCRYASENSEHPERTRMMYQYGRALDKAGNPEALRVLFEAGENYGYPMALYHLALLYDEAQYTQKDPVLYERFLRTAARKKNIPAMHDLAELLLRTPRSPERSREAHLMLVEAGRADHLSSMVLLGREMMYGWVPEATPSMGVDWLKSAAEAESAEAMWLLSLYYEGGFGSDPDPEQSAGYLRGAAIEGHKKARAKAGWD